MEKLSPKLYAQAVKASDLLNDAAASKNVLKSVEWSPRFKNDFLLHGKMPKPQYSKMDISDSREKIREARALCEADHVVFQWLNRLCDVMENTAGLIQTRGTPEFFQFSTALFGQPTRLMLDKQTRVLDLARHLDSALDDLNFSNLVIEGYDESLNAQAFSKALRRRLKKHFGADAPKVAISKSVSAKAAASSSRIRVRADASFTERDVDQLLHHEALVHVATGKNGQLQEDFKILGRSHSGTTEVQEGLAVFAEIVTGSMDPKRFARLSGRVLAIEMAIQGADFKEVFDFFVQRNDDPSQSFENTRRVFRGGVISGGAPFTKDMVYLNGLLRVHNFMRSVVKLNRADLIRVLFCGKMDIEDVPALAHLVSYDRLEPPKFMPPWVKDLRFLVSYMAYSSFLNQVKMPGFQAYYAQELDQVPVIWSFADGESG
ncbi:uncharacterized protein (TIGR02421 family) [Litorimonas taeanensis]|uniref:Uncharacterized protein (TIGR02421 family) n=1 Tax=Litorimonas taeanensis TaxID=568099 RepID=A0A420WKR6_9PROT|nr:flavohemoglobin expression-modulating QEGLA motif protein [Litorimonas taeanensis]RKQ71608.1 uncharacterized protein (TIGR02421 family) [Litorimonas taeanensis]